MQLPLLRYLTIVDHAEASATDGGGPLRKVAVVGFVKNPHAGAFGADLAPMIEASVALGEQLSAMALAAMAPYPAVSYGKGGVAGLLGQQEHVNALLTTAFANPLREAMGGAAWISSLTKRAAPGGSIDIPLAHKDALYVRSHYDGMTIALPDGPQPDEIAVILCLANRGRIDARVGGLHADAVEGRDGLR